MKNKKVIRLTESDLHRIVSEAVEAVLDEQNWMGRLYDKFSPKSRKETERRQRKYMDKDGNWRSNARRGYVDSNGDYVSRYEVDAENGYGRNYE